MGPAFRSRADSLDEAVASVHRGTAARVRGQLERGTALLLGERADPAAAAAAAGSALDELALAVHDANATLPGDLVTEMAVQATELRAYALEVGEPLPGGFRRDFLARIAPGAIFGDWHFGVPASITMAQAILESGWGKVAPGYNLFGMKGQGTAGSERHRVVEYRRGKRSIHRAEFRSYRSFAESIADHARVLGTSERYAPARMAGDNAALYAQALQGKYATDPRYAKKLGDLADLYHLARFDWCPTSPTADPGLAVAPVASGAIASVGPFSR